MPLFTWDKVLRIVLTILNILSACLKSFGIDDAKEPEIESEESTSGHA